ncbi:hypothetical protein VM1G_08681 [Cytospora mali]|uniref:Uncharacterized protein n=1 Tax=Cytospora mali TaxID=578113 RepID=A0A194WBE3_CYTMA|nr:hypothetical protein VM1G_08681 [Valsa mali]
MAYVYDKSDSDSVISVSSRIEQQLTTTNASINIPIPPITLEWNSAASSASSSTGSPEPFLPENVQKSLQPQKATGQDSSLRRSSPNPLRRDKDRLISANIESPRPASPDNRPDRASAEQKNNEDGNVNSYRLQRKRRRLSPTSTGPEQEVQKRGRGRPKKRICAGKSTGPE